MLSRRALRLKCILRGESVRQHQPRFTRVREQEGRQARSAPSRRRLRPRASNRPQNGSDGNSRPQSGPDQTVVAAVLGRWHPDPDSLRLRRQPEMLPGTAGCVYRRPTGVPPTQRDPVPAAAAGCHSKIGYAGTNYPPRRRRPHLTRIYLRRDGGYGSPCWHCGRTGPRFWCSAARVSVTMN